MLRVWTTGTKKLRHGGNPVLAWMARNLALKQDAAGNLKPDRERSADKIDGIVALVEAIGVSITKTETPPVSGMNARAARGEPVFRTL